MKGNFKKGDRVYHKNLKLYGIFQEYDWASEDFCFVTFDSEDNYDDTRCVSLNQLVSVKPKSI